MSLKHKVRINLACVALDNQSPSGFYKFLVTNKGMRMPNSLIYGEREIDDVINNIISRHIRMNSEWMNYRLINVDRKKLENLSYELNLNYLGVIPYPMETLKGKWIDLKDVVHGGEKINESYQKILSEAAGFIG